MLKAHWQLVFIWVIMNMQCELKREDWNGCDILWCNWKSNDSDPQKFVIPFVALSEEIYPSGFGRPLWLTTVLRLLCQSLCTGNQLLIFISSVISNHADKFIGAIFTWRLLLLQLLTSHLQVLLCTLEISLLETIEQVEVTWAILSPSVWWT